MIIFGLELVKPKYHREAPYFVDKNIIKKGETERADIEIKINKILNSHTLILKKI